MSFALKEKDSFSSISLEMVAKSKFSLTRKTTKKTGTFFTHLYAEETSWELKEPLVDQTPVSFHFCPS